MSTEFFRKYLDILDEAATPTDPAREELIRVLRGHSPDDPYELFDTLKDLAREFNTPVGQEIKMMLRTQSPDDAADLWATSLDIAGVTDADLEAMADDDDYDDESRARLDAIQAKYGPCPLGQ